MEKADKEMDRPGRGPLHITFQEWMDADMPVGEWRDCDTLDYAQRTVMHYWWKFGGNARYDNFEALARIHAGGPKGAEKESTKEYWTRVSAHLK